MADCLGADRGGRRRPDRVYSRGTVGHFAWGRVLLASGDPSLGRARELIAAPPLSLGLVAIRWSIIDAVRGIGAPTRLPVDQ